MLGPQSNNAKRANAAKKSRNGGLIAFLILCVLAIGAIYFLFFANTEVMGKLRERKQKNSRIAEVEPSLASDNDAGQQAEEVTAAETPQNDKAEPSEFDDGRVLTSIKTNGMYIVEMYDMPDGKKLKKYRYSVKSIWNNSTDQLLHMALTTPPGVEMPPLPYTYGSLTKEFYDSLATPIIINDDDSEEVREAKERIIQARETVSRLLSEGYTFEDILADHEMNNREEASMRREVAERIEEIKREGDIEMARDYMNRANELLRNAGITEVYDRTLETEE
jgi:flagellar basal body-associated protein FliL